MSDVEQNFPLAPLRNHSQVESDLLLGRDVNRGDGREEFHSSNDEINIVDEDQGYPSASISLFAKYAVFSGLLVTTTISFVLLAGAVQKWTLSESGGFYHVVISNRASSQLIVQVLANFFELIHVAVLCALINYATRIRLSSTATSLDALRFWHNLSAQKMQWSLPLRFLIPLFGFIAITVVPSALWAGAITPVDTSVNRTTTIYIPSYQNATLVHEYLDRSGASVSSLRSTRGFFTYNVGESLLGPILASGSSATTVDGTARQHAKLDNARITYHGRSYGVGAAVGLLDDKILGNPRTIEYHFQERGYNANVTCIYNQSSKYVIGENGNGAYVAQGSLPDGSHEYMEYYGYGSGPMVMIAAGYTDATKSGVLSIAAGSAYSFLSNVQCSVDFKPTMFNISVGTVGRNITATPVSSTAIGDIELSGDLAATAIFQLSIIATDQTGLYTSLVGITLNNSISDYNLSIANAGLEPVSEANATLTGLENAFTAMIDDVLGAYAAAQIMISNVTSNTTGTIKVVALQFGQVIYIYAVVVMNALILVAVLVEGLRTRVWKGLGQFDYMNIGDVITDTLRGRTEIAVAIEHNHAKGLGISQAVGRSKVIHKCGRLSSASDPADSGRSF